MLYLLVTGLTLLGASVRAANTGSFSVQRYDLTFYLDIASSQDTFSGEAEIVIQTPDKLDNDVTKIVLNGHNLNISYGLITYPDTRKVTIDTKQIETNNKTQEITLNIPEALVANSVYTMRLVYSGKIYSDGGLVRIKENSNYLVTVLYPGYSRRLYPCLDAPNSRATYNINLNVTYTGNTAPQIVTGLRLTDRRSSDYMGKTVSEKYTTDGTLPPYGITFTIGDYKPFKELPNILIPASMTENIVSRNAINAMQVKTIRSLFSAANIDDFYMKLVLVPGLPVASTSGYAFAAISQDLGTELGITTTPALKYQAKTILTALVKTIYGTVVSPSTWADIWIAESVSLYIATAVLPEISRWEDWKTIELVDLNQMALEKSWSESSMPVRPDSFASLDDVLKFLADPAVIKGAAILRMIETLPQTSPEVNAFINLIKDRRGNALTSEELLDKYEEYGQMNGTLPDQKRLKEIVLPWLKQTGFPALTISRDGSDIVATESRFMPSKNKDSAWIVPISYIQTSNGSNDISKMTWLNSETNSKAQLAVKVSENDTVFVNIKGPGLFRVTYDHTDMEIIGNHLKTSVDIVPPEVRTTIISDGMAFAKAGVLKYYTLLSTLRYLVNERSLSPWLVASKGCKELWQLLYFTDLKTQYENYATGLLRASYIDNEIGGLGLKDSSLSKGVLRREIVGHLCDLEDFNCRNATTNAYKYYIPNKEHEIVAADMVPVIYCNGLRGEKSGTNLEKLLWSKYAPADPPDVKRNVFSYLACPTSNLTLEGLLTPVLLSNTVIPSNDIVMAFEEVAKRPEHIDYLLDFLTKYYTKLTTKLKLEHKAEMIRIIGEVASTNYHLQKVQNFNFGDSPVIKDAVANALSSIQARQKFLKDNYEDIKVGLYGHTPIPPGPTTTPTGPTDGPNPSPTNSPKPTKKPSNSATSQTAAVLFVFTAILTLFASN